MVTSSCGTGYLTMTLSGPDVAYGIIQISETTPTKRPPSAEWGYYQWIGFQFARTTVLGLVLRIQRVFPLTGTHQVLVLHRRYGKHKPHPDVDHLPSLLATYYPTSYGAWSPACGRPGHRAHPTPSAQ